MGRPSSPTMSIGRPTTPRAGWLIWPPRTMAIGAQRSMLIRGASGAIPSTTRRLSGTAVRPPDNGDRALLSGRARACL